MLETFYLYLESVFAWFFGSTILQDTFCAWCVKALEFYLGIWLLYLLIAKPILYLIKVIDSKIYSKR